MIFVPEVKAGQTTGITLLHVRFHDRLPAAVMRGVLQGYDRRYDRLVDWVSETEGSFDESMLAEMPVAELLIEPISDTADHWRRDRSSVTRCRVIGIGIDARRHRTVPPVARSGRRRCASGCSPRSSWSTSRPRPTRSRRSAARFAAREAVMKALGVGLGAFGFHDVWVERADAGARLAGGHAAAADLASAAGVTAWHLSLTHSDHVAAAYVIAE